MTKYEVSMIKLSICVLGIYACFLTWGVTQEKVTSTEYSGGKFRYFIVLNVVQSLIASLVGFIYLKIQRKPLFTTNIADRSLLRHFLYLSILVTIASPFGYASLKHIDYPTMVITPFKAPLV
jgi:UDP-galactose transporter B1